MVSNTHIPSTVNSSRSSAAAAVRHPLELLLAIARNLCHEAGGAHACAFVAVLVRWRYRRRSNLFERVRHGVITLDASVCCSWKELHPDRS